MLSAAEKAVSKRSLFGARINPILVCLQIPLVIMLTLKNYMCGCAVRDKQRLRCCENNCALCFLQPSAVSDGEASQADSEDEDEALPAAIKPPRGRPFAASESTPNVGKRKGVRAEYARENRKTSSIEL